jgi:bifunctional non-homologous end joining protein LigD
MAVPKTIQPQICTSSESTFEGDAWLHEIKYDGWRLMARKDGAAVQLLTREGVDMTAQLPKIAAEITALDVRDAWFDGELVYVNQQSVPDFGSLMGSVRAADERRLFCQVFDTPWYDGRSLAKMPLIERKFLLGELLEGREAKVRFTDHVVGRGRDVFAGADRMDLEGIVSKRADSPYRAGVRSRDWLKVKCWRTHAFVLGGIERDDEDRVTALLVGSVDGSGLRYEGRVEFGLGRVSSTLENATPIAECPFGEIISRRRTWLEPRTIIELRALPRAVGAPLRHATALRAIGSNAGAGLLRNPLTSAKAKL